MALLHGGASITPGKLELVERWLPTTTWFGAGGAGLTLVGAYRFDDPDGDVGIETHLVRDARGRTIQVPLTYRGAPIAGGDEWLVGTMEHSVLGTRWTYDACGDPVYAAVLARTILTGGRQAELRRELPDGRSEITEPAVRVQGSGRLPDPGGIGLVDVRDEGGTTTVLTSAARVLVRRVVDTEPAVRGPDDLELTGTWAGVDEPVVLAVASVGS